MSVAIQGVAPVGRMICRSCVLFVDNFPQTSKSAFFTERIVEFKEAVEPSNPGVISFYSSMSLTKHARDSSNEEPFVLLNVFSRDSYLGADANAFASSHSIDAQLYFSTPVLFAKLQRDRRRCRKNKRSEAQTPSADRSQEQRGHKRVYNAATTAQTISSTACWSRYDHTVCHCFSEESATNVDLNDCKVRIFATMQDNFVHGMHIGLNVSIARQPVSLSIVDTDFESLPNEDFGSPRWSEGLPTD